MQHRTEDKEQDVTQKKKLEKQKKILKILQRNIGMICFAGCYCYIVNIVISYPSICLFLETLTM